VSEPTDQQSLKQQAEQAFHRFLALARKGEADGKSFAASLDENIRNIFDELLIDYEALRGMLGEQPLGISAGRMIGEFKLIKSIGQGGMGMVWEAEQTTLGRSVALKLLFPHLGLLPRTLERFQREAVTGGKLAHPGIVRVIATGEFEGINYIAQELVSDGWSLADSINELRDRAQLPPSYFKTVAKTFLSVTEAMGAAHDDGIVHRDLKPGNILMTKDGRPRVADFGLAKIHEDLSLSVSGELTGTPSFMSPEQASRGHRPVNYQTDIFSLGASLYEALTMERPFKGEDRDQVLEQIRIQDPPAPNKIRKAIPVELSAICMKAMEKALVHRYDSMQSFAADLNAFLNGERVNASPTSFGVRVWRFARRRPRRSLAAFTLLISISTTVTTIQLMNVAQQKRKSAEVNTEQTQSSLEDVSLLIEKLLQPDAESRELVSTTGRRDLAEATHALAQSDENIAPELKARLLSASGKAFEEFGDFENAKISYNFAIAELIIAHGKWHPETLKTESKLANILSNEGRYTEATELLERVYRDCVTFLDFDSPITWASANLLGDIYAMTGRPEEGRELMEASVRYLRKDGEAMNLLWLKALSRLAAGHNYSSRYQLAVDSFLQVVEGDIALRGKQDPTTLSNISNLVNSLANNGQGEEAIRWADEYLPLIKQTFSENHRLYLSLLSNKSIGYGAAGKPLEAYRLASDILSIRIGKYGGKHPKTLSSLALCGKYAGTTGDHEHAIKLLRSALSGATEVKGANSSSALLYGMRLGDQYLALNRRDEARAVWNKSLNGYISEYGEEHINVMQLREKLASIPD